MQTILIIDDSRVNQHMLRLVLRRNGYQTLIANNGQEGLGILAEEKVHIVICDINMPVMNGFEFLEAHRSDATIAHIPVLMLTALGEDGTSEKAIELGANGCITQPFESHVLSNTVKALILMDDDSQ